MDPFSLAASIVVPDINVRAISDFIYRSGDSEHNLRKSDERRSRSKSREKDEKRGRSKSPARLDLADGQDNGKSSPRGRRKEKSPQPRPAEPLQIKSERFWDVSVFIAEERKSRVIYIDSDGIKVVESSSNHKGHVYPFNEISNFHISNKIVKWNHNEKQFRFETEKGEEEEIQEAFLKALGASTYEKGAPEVADVELLVNDVETPEGQESKKGFFARLSPIVHRRSKSRSKSPRRESPTSSPPSLSKSSPNSTAQHTLENESLVTEEEKEISGNSEKRGRKKVDGLSPASLSPAVPSTRKRSPSPRREKQPEGKFEKFTDLEDNQ